jgi:hypothetical protein
MKLVKHVKMAIICDDEDWERLSKYPVVAP